MEEWKMKIVVCIKQVPDDSVEISLNSSTGKPNFDGVTQIVNAFDTYALEMATRLKEKAGGEIYEIQKNGINAFSCIHVCGGTERMRRFFKRRK